jgi:hypothetical protein
MKFYVENGWHRAGNNPANINISLIKEEISFYYLLQDPRANIMCFPTFVTFPPLLEFFTPFTICIANTTAQKYPQEKVETRVGQYEIELSI